jgi:FkbM family methyltransferase
MNELKDCRWGSMLYNQHDIYIGRSLQVYGEFSEGECDLFRQFVQPGWTIVEMGANIGSHTVPLAKWIGGKGRLYAFEPQRIVFQTLCANIALNDLLNVVAFQQAVGSQSGAIIVPELNYESENNFGGLELGRFQQGEKVPLVTLDSLSLEACHFIKMDIEGMEREAIVGAQATIQRFRPLLYLENDRQDREAELIRTLASLGYQMYCHYPPLFNPRNYFKETRNIFGDLVSKNLLCVHQSIPQQINLPKIEWH